MNIKEIVVNAGYDKPTNNWATKALNDALSNGMELIAIQQGYHQISKNNKKWNFKIKINGLTFVEFIPTNRVEINDVLVKIAIWLSKIIQKYKSSEQFISKISSIKCDKCGGKGIIPMFSHYADGVCFKCLGSGNLLKMNK